MSRRPANPFPKGSSGNPQGRPRGSRNKATKTMTEVILAATDIIGGAEELARLYHADKAFRTVFWRDIASKVLPKIIEGPMDISPPTRVIEHFLVAPDGTVVDPAFLDLNGLADDGTEH